MGENEVLRMFLAGQRAAFRSIVDGLDEQQVRAVPSASSMCLAVLVKHAIDGEETMTGRIAGDPPADDPVARWQSGWRVGDDETLAALLARWDTVAARTEKVLAAEDDLDREVPLPESVRRWMPNEGAYTVRWLVLHELEELARHAGHGDIIRESIDGAVGYLGKQRPA
ncbi:DinB family protein [Actinocatenispora rupis]|uniref:DinB family protein n=1 Tax=Actinocatenispora rupis TaxID=519421 RepID=A0A8J3J6S6_9ACTN|nr:DinB family protein [Actinocatenispora rupis]GID15885.1 hypothetical protein Aru02nite_67740 [Actinocatenispora rupis]